MLMFTVGLFKIFNCLMHAMKNLKQNILHYYVRTPH